MYKDKLKETKGILNKYENKNKKKVEDVGNPNKDMKKEKDDEITFASLFEKEEDDEDEEFVRATYYLEQELIDKINKYSKEAGKFKSEFMRDMLRLVFAKKEQEQKQGKE